MQCKHLFDKEENNALQSSRLNTHLSRCGSIKITKKSNEKNLIVFDVSHPNGLKNILKRRVFVKYDRDVTRVDDSILNIPAVAGIITVAWAFGIDVCIDTLDRSYLKSLEKIKQVMRHWHPYFPMTTQIHVNKVITNNFSNNGFGLLFTGGVDSTTSYIKYRRKKPTLFHVFEEDTHRSLNNKEATKLQKHLARFAKQERAQIHFLATNIPPGKKQQAALYKRYGFQWWEYLCHGIILTSLCAPLAFIENEGFLILASTRTPHTEFQDVFGFGDHPLIMNNLSWANVKVLLDGYEMSRQDKIQALRIFTQRTGCNPCIRVCNHPVVSNCSRCEKCIHTIMGLLVEGVDPRKVGFSNVDEEFFNHAKKYIERNMFLRKELVEKKGTFLMKKLKLESFREIQRSIPKYMNSSLPYSKGFFLWFNTLDLDLLYESFKEMNLSQLLRLSLIHLYDQSPLHIRNLIKSLFKRSRFMLRH